MSELGLQFLRCKDCAGSVVNVGIQPNSTTNDRENNGKARGNNEVEPLGEARALSLAGLASVMMRISRHYRP